MPAHAPEFKGPIEGYVVNFLTKNLWRIAATHDFDDAKQEAYAVFLRTASRYPLVETPQHFMSLFKTSWTNEFNDLAWKATEARKVLTEADLTPHEEGTAQLDLVGETDNNGQLAVMIRQAPQEVLMVLNLFLTAPQELLDLALTTWRKNGKYRADGDKAVARMLGLPKNATPMTSTKEYFSPD